MNLLVISDSHRALEPVRKLLTLYAGRVDMVAHLGDHAGDLLGLSQEYPGLRMAAVSGNCDYGGVPEQILPINGKKILLTHGHRQQVKFGYDRLAYYAMEKEADACLFGHTHMPAVFEVGSITFMNPGSVSQPRAAERPAYGLLSVSDEGVIRGTVLYL